MTPQYHQSRQMWRSYMDIYLNPFTKGLNSKGSDPLCSLRRRSFPALLDMRSANLEFNHLTIIWNSQWYSGTYRNFIINTFMLVLGSLFLRQWIIPSTEYFVARMVKLLSCIQLTLFQPSRSAAIKRFNCNGKVRQIINLCMHLMMSNISHF